jgi:acyl-CoA reductase-like NAD-dependent aldehyde dehydrogenase
MVPPMPDVLATALALVDPLPPGERRSLLVRWADRLQLHAEELARAITTATRKPIRLARNEVERGLATIRGTAEAMDLLAPRSHSLDANGSAEIHRVPLGPVLAVTPFNFPLNLALHKLAPAIAAGCPVIWKPSPQAPGVAELALQHLLNADAPEGLVQIAQLDNDAVAALVRDERLAVLSFTGSAAVGHHLQKLATRAKVMLELGGNAAVILHQLDDPATVARQVALGACAHAGQVCISVQRIFIPTERPDWKQALVEAFRALPSGDPWNEATISGPLISAAAKERVSALLERYRAQGGTLLTGGGWDGLVLAPTLVDGLPAIAPGVYDTEAFAPLATIHEYGDVAGAIHLAELSPFGLQCGLYSHDEAVIQRAFAALNVGTLVVGNVPTRRDDRLPYGGMKDSGCGREGTFETVLDYTQAKVLWRTA